MRGTCCARFLRRYTAGNPDLTFPHVRYNVIDHLKCMTPRRGVLFFFFYLMNCRPIRYRTRMGPATSEIFWYYFEKSVHSRILQVRLGVLYGLTEFWELKPPTTKFIWDFGCLRNYVTECSSIKNKINKNTKVAKKSKLRLPVNLLGLFVNTWIN